VPKLNKKFDWDWNISRPDENFEIRETLILGIF
jgi:hypothetical protein